MIDKDSRIRKGLAPKRNRTCLQVQQEIVIPAGTIMRQTSEGMFECPVGNGMFSVTRTSADLHQADFKKVVA